MKSEWNCNYWEMSTTNNLIKYIKTNNFNNNKLVITNKSFGSLQFAYYSFMVIEVDIARFFSRSRSEIPKKLQEI